MENTTQYPLFCPCADQNEFESLDNQACELLNYPNAGAQDYCNPIIDVNGKYYFIVNQEVSSLVDLSKCVPYEDIVLPPVE